MRSRVPLLLVVAVTADAKGKGTKSGRERPVTLVEGSRTRRATAEAGQMPRLPPARPSQRRPWPWGRGSRARPTLYQDGIMVAEAVMHYLGKAISVGLVWLAAGSTLFAGLPSVDCRCANGRVRSLCSGLPSGDTGCCCGGACCSAPGSDSCCRGKAASHAGGTAKKSCCGRQNADEPSQPPAKSGCSLTGACCTRIAHQPDAVLCTPVDSGACPDFSARALPAALAPATSAPAAPGLGGTLRGARGIRRHRHRT